MFTQTSQMSVLLFTHVLHIIWDENWTKCKDINNNKKIEKYEKLKFIFKMFGKLDTKIPKRSCPPTEVTLSGFRRAKTITKTKRNHQSCRKLVGPRHECIDVAFDRNRNAVWCLRNGNPSRQGQNIVVSQTARAHSYSSPTNVFTYCDVTSCDFSPIAHHRPTREMCPEPD